MAITYVATNVASADYINLPAGTAVGDVAICEIQTQQVVPTTATRLARDSSQNRHALFYKVLTSADVTNGRISLANGSIDYLGGTPGYSGTYIVSVFRGVKSPPILLSSPDLNELNIAGAGTQLTLPLTGTATSSGMLVWQVDVYSAINSPTPPVGWTMVAGTAGTYNVGFYKSISVGPIPTAQFTISCQNSGVSAGGWHGAVLLRDNSPPTVTLSSLTTIDPRVNNTVSWTYSDADGNPQSAYELEYRVPGGMWSSVSIGTSASSHIIPANFLEDERDYEIRLRVSDGNIWSEYATDTFRADSWTYYPEGTVFTSTPAYADIVKADEPVGYWRLGENSGTVAVDSSGNGRNGTYVGSSSTAGSLIASDPDPSRSFAGGHVETTTGAPTNANSSIEAWFEVSGVQAGAIIKSGTGANGYSVGIGASNYSADGRNLVALFPNVRWITTGVSIPDGIHHVVMTLDSNQYPSIYLDGALVYSDALTIPAAATGGIAIARNIGDEAGGNRDFIGRIDEAAVYNRALTEAEIKRHYDAGKGIAINSKATISTATLDTTSEYEVQVKAKDGYHYSEWSPSADLVFTRHYVYEGGVWKASQKQQYWINDWRNGDATNF